MIFKLLNFFIIIFIQDKSVLDKWILMNKASILEFVGLLAWKIFKKVD